MAENAELENLDQLVNSPGWTLFQQMVDKEWGRTGDRYIDAVTNAARGEDTAAVGILRQILAAQREIGIVMAMVPNRIKMLKLQQPVGAGQSRRGGL